MDVINSSKSYKKIDKLIIKFDQVPSGYEHGSPSHSLFPGQIGVWRGDWRKENEEKYPRQNETFNKKMTLGSGFSIVALTKRARNFD